MQITYHGKSFFEIDIKNSENEKIIVVINPFDKDSKLKCPKIESNILLLSDSRKKLSDIQEKIGKPLLINQAGEYERKEVFINGIALFNKEEKFFNIIYKLESEKIKICYLSDFSQKKLSSEQLEQIGQIDILIIPVEEDSVLDLKEIAAIISQIEPRIVIPMLYGKLDKFLKIMGAEGVEHQKKLKINQKDLPKEEIEIIVLEP